MSYISAGNTTTTTLVQYGDTTGNLVFATGGANTAALKLDNAQNAQLTASGAKLLNSSGNPILQQTGSVLQVVQGTTTTTVANQTTSYVDSTLTANITPTSTTSKILVIIGQMVRVYSQTNNYLVGRVQLLRGATVVGAYVNATELSATTGSGGYMIGGATQAFNYLDSPANTSTQTYKTQIAMSTTGSGSTCEAQSAGSLSTMILMEIAA